MPYQSIKLHITPAQQKKAIMGSGIRLGANCIGDGQLVMLHPMNYKKIANAKGGVQLVLSPGEIMQTAAYHDILPQGDTSLSGSGFFDSVWAGIKGVGKFLKDTGIGSTLADVAQGVLSPILGENVTKGLREGLRGATGVGLGPALKAAKYRITNAKSKEIHHVNVQPKSEAGKHKDVSTWINNPLASTTYPGKKKNKIAVGSGLYI